MVRANLPKSGAISSGRDEPQKNAASRISERSEEERDDSVNLKKAINDK